ncbi:MAG TPA: class I SAM-dependent methyltransferase [Pyrinomonadaceae bacterium]|nr:class I SAM-dependent methyltransferase [Pyrinomonadaceae bacterium]
MSNYDEVLYEGYAFPQTHPDRLATIASLAGMTPAPVERCRVLEIGCGDGGNLLPMALTLPASEFVGIDLGALHIKKGQDTAARLGLNNLSLLHMDVMELGEDLGRFDYVIAHGFFSWVPPEPREKALAVCRAHLSPHGVAFVSYNANPGFHVRRMLREMMLFHTRHITDAREQIGQSKALLRFLLDAQVKRNAYQTLLREEAERISKHADDHFYHDDLEPFNEPFYFHEFVELAARHGLQYLGEADYFETQDTSLSPQGAERLRQLGDNPVLREQYADFIKCRGFRQTLLCHAEVEPERTPRASRLKDFYVASAARPAEPEPDVKSSSVVRFEGAHGATVQTDHPLTKAAILHLGEHWPRALHFDQLLAGARTRLGRDDAGSLRRDEADSLHNADSLSQDSEALCEVLLRLYGANLVELRTHAPRFAAQASERPLASPLARLQAQRSEVVTSLRHTTIRMDDPLARHLLTLLDGNRDRPALLDALLALAHTGALQLQDQGQPLNDPARLQTLLCERIEENLTNLARHALLVE